MKPEHPGLAFYFHLRRPRVLRGRGDADCVTQVTHRLVAPHLDAHDALPVLAFSLVQHAILPTYYYLTLLYLTEKYMYVPIFCSFFFLYLN